MNSRIIAIIDACDAMTNGRPCGKAMNASQAINELNSEAGNQFDLWLVNKFTASLFSEGILPQGTL